MFVGRVRLGVWVVVLVVCVYVGVGGVVLYGCVVCDLLIFLQTVAAKLLRSAGDAAACGQTGRIEPQHIWQVRSTHTYIYIYMYIYVYIDI